MGKSITKKESRFLSTTIACCGLFLIGSGLVMNVNSNDTIIKHNYTVAVTEQKVNHSKTNEIKLKQIELEINNPISLNIKDYIENADQIEDSVLKALKLDTSLVNINQAGSYTYTVSYKKKKYNWTFVIKEKPLPQVELTLKNLSLEKGAALSTNVSAYIVETLSEEVRNHIIINLKDVNTAKPGEYQYTVTYNNRMYTGKIWIYEKQPTIITPNTPDTPSTEGEKTETTPTTPTVPTTPTAPETPESNS